MTQASLNHEDRPNAERPNAERPSAERPSAERPSAERKDEARQARQALRAWYAALREKQKPSVVFEMPDLAVPGEALSRPEAEFFMEHGFLVKPGLLEAGRVDAAMQRVWDYLLEHLPAVGDWQPLPDKPDTWRNPRWPDVPPADESGPYQGRRRIDFMGNTVKLHDLGGADFIVDLLPRNPEVRAVADAMLGNLRASERTRGVYGVFPADSSDASSEPLSARLLPHLDQVCQQLNVCAYFGDVAPRNGGFTIYPGSHRVMFPAFETESNWRPTEGFNDCLWRAVESIEPWEIVAEKGSVVFWHGRSVHSSGIHDGDDIRWAAFADFMRDEPVLDDDEHRKRGQFEWFKDTRMLRDDAPVSDDLWRGWRLGEALRE